MIDSNSASIIADAYLKGARGYDIHTLYEALLKNSQNEGPLNSVGRKGMKYYNWLGYIPTLDGMHKFLTLKFLEQTNVPIHFLHFIFILCH
jgi:putative alpha-1,2-mannosidase